MIKLEQIEARAHELFNRIIDKTGDNAYSVRIEDSMASAVQGCVDINVYHYNNLVQTFAVFPRTEHWERVVYA